ncbi:MAG: AraC family transcriptional regulator [Christensenellales bacterium]
MKVNELARLLQATVLSEGDQEKEVSGGYVCDLLSWVMARCGEGAAWITVQTHLNVIAVAALLDLSCVIIPDAIQVEQASIDKAREEGIWLLSVDYPAFEICRIMVQAGFGSSRRK